MTHPTCTVHGQMHYDMACDWYVCPGYDGEGCPAKITSEELERYGWDAIKPPSGPFEEEP